MALPALASGSVTLWPVLPGQALATHARPARSGAGCPTRKPCTTKGATHRCSTCGHAGSPRNRASGILVWASLDRWPQRDMWQPCGGECSSTDGPPPLRVTRQYVNIDVEGSAAGAYVRFWEPGRVHGSGIDDEFHICRRFFHICGECKLEATVPALRA